MSVSFTAASLVVQAPDFHVIVYTAPPWTDACGRFTADEPTAVWLFNMNLCERLADEPPASKNPKTHP